MAASSFGDQGPRAERLSWVGRRPAASGPIRLPGFTREITQPDTAPSRVSCSCGIGMAQYMDCQKRYCGVPCQTSQKFKH
jgi:hypothetical protein